MSQTRNRDLSEPLGSHSIVSCAACYNRDDHLYCSHGERRTFPCNGCDCFGLFVRQVLQNDSNEQKYFLNQKGEDREIWLVNKLKEVSEMMGGPNWRSFIRKLSKKRRSYKFRYDPESYALNFDCGFDGEEDGLMCGFASRFASPTPDYRGPM